MEGLVRPDSRDMRELIDKEVVKQEARFEQLLKQWDEKYATLTAFHIVISNTSCIESYFNVC